MTDVAGGFLDHVQQHPPQGRRCRAEVGMSPDFVQRGRRHDFVRQVALAPVLVRQLRKGDALDDHVGVLGVVHELRAFGGAPREEHLEPAVLDPPQMGNHAGDRHQW